MFKLHYVTYWLSDTFHIFKTYYCRNAFQILTVIVLTYMDYILQCEVHPCFNFGVVNLQYFHTFDIIDPPPSPSKLLFNLSGTKFSWPIPNCCFVDWSLPWIWWLLQDFFRSFTWFWSKFVHHSCSAVMMNGVWEGEGAFTSFIIWMCGLRYWGTLSSVRWKQ